MLKLYKYNGFTFQYEEGEQPDGAVEVKPQKERKTPNKARAPRTKKA